MEIRNIFFLSLILAFTQTRGFSAQVASAPCQMVSQAGEICYGPIARLHPTQMAVGFIEVEAKRKILEQSDG